jgi:hypothetical protein
MTVISLDAAAQVVVVVGGTVALVLAVLEIVETTMTIIDKVRDWRETHKGPHL